MLSVWQQSKTSVYIPDEIQSKIVRDRIKKVGELSITPPVAWVQSNEWPVCCDDYMKYIGEWEKTVLLINRVMRNI